MLDHPCLHVGRLFFQYTPLCKTSSINSIHQSREFSSLVIWELFSFFLKREKHLNKIIDLWWKNISHKCSLSFLPSLFSLLILQFQFSRSVVSNSLCPHSLQHTRHPSPSPTPRVYSDSCLLSRWCHPTISSSVVPFSSCLQSFPASGSFQMSQFFTSGG